ncbi:hypothetical protein KI387_031656, partial [Taxus chinensis]
MRHSSIKRTRHASEFSALDVIKKTCAARVLPALSSRDEELDRKWQDQRNVETEANIKRFTLFKEELDLLREKLRASL